MEKRKHLAVWVGPETHERCRAVAQARGMTVSGLLGELVDDVLDAAPHDPTSTKITREVRPERVAIRLRPGDIHALVRRATVRRMKPSTYIAALVRAHLVEDPPLPPAELAVLERALAEVAAIGRNLNQITRAVNAGAAVPPGMASIIGRSVEAVEAVRQAARAYVAKAVASWEAPLG